MINCVAVPFLARYGIADWLSAKNGVKMKPKTIKNIRRVFFINKIFKLGEMNTHLQ
jgi:hypothetical protein